jgi:hypothetical protein
MPKQTIVAIENSYLQNVTFWEKGEKYKWISVFVRALQMIRLKMIGEIERKSRNVGMNQAASEIAYQLFKDYAHTVKNVSPQQKGAKWSKNGIKLGRMIASSFIKQNRLKYLGDVNKLKEDELDALKMLSFVL